MFALRIARWGIVGFAMATLLAACGTTQAPRHASKHGTRTHLPTPQIVATSQRSQCVPYARMISNVHIRGDAWTWWQSAHGNYGRSKRPHVGAVMVLSKTSRLTYGHLAVVTRVVSDREILVEHANWLNKGRVHKHQLVRDVSARGDWSAVKLWYTPGQVMGVTTYPVSGFVHAGRSGPTRTRTS